MRIFISAGEPSGDLHGANLVRTLRRLYPGVECVGFGGERMEAEGCRLLYPLCRLAVMWFLHVLAHAPTFLGLLSRAARFVGHPYFDELRRQPFDADFVAKARGGPEVPIALLPGSRTQEVTRNLS